MKIEEGGKMEETELLPLKGFPFTIKLKIA